MNFCDVGHSSRNRRLLAGVAAAAAGCVGGPGRIDLPGRGAGSPAGLRAGGAGAGAPALAAGRDRSRPQRPAGRRSRCRGTAGRAPLRPGDSALEALVPCPADDRGPPDHGLGRGHLRARVRPLLARVPGRRDLRPRPFAAARPGGGPGHGRGGGEPVVLADAGVGLAGTLAARAGSVRTDPARTCQRVSRPPSGFGDSRAGIARERARAVRQRHSG